MTDTTLTLGTSTTLDYFGVDDDLLTTIATTASTSILASHPINNYHYHYYYANNYIESLSDEQLIAIHKLLNEKEQELEHPKQLIKMKQS